MSCQDDDYEEIKSTLKYVSLAISISNGRNLIADSEVLRMQHENDQAKDFLRVQFGLAESHIDFLKEFYSLTQYAYDSSWIKEKSRWTCKLDQFRARTCSSIAWVRKFDAKCSYKDEPRYLMVLPQETFDCDLLYSHIDIHRNSRISLTVANTSYVSNYTLSEMSSNEDTYERHAYTPLKVTSPNQPGLYMIRIKTDVAGKLKSSNYGLSEEWMFDFVAWLRVVPPPLPQPCDTKAVLTHGAVFGLDSDFKPVLYQPKTLNISIFIRQLKGVNDTNANAALEKILNLTFEEENRRLMGPDSFNLMRELFIIIRDDKGTAKTTALSILWNLSCDHECRLNLVNPSLGLLDLLVKGVLKNEVGRSRILIAVLSIYSNLVNENRALLGSPALGLISLCSEIIKRDKSDAKNRAMGLLMNVTCNSTPNKILAGAPALGIAETLVKVLIEEKGNEKAISQALGCIWNINLVIENVPSFIRLNMEVPLVELLKNFDTYEEQVKKSLSTVFLVYCRHPGAAAAVRIVPSVLEALEPIAKLQDSNGLRALFVISQLIGRDEEDVRFMRGMSLLASQAGALDQIVDVLSNNINGRDGRDYKFGNFDLNAVTSAILSLSLSDSNKRIMVQNRQLLLNLVILIKSFVNNDVQFPPADPQSTNGVGGGGKDSETASNVVETLLQLSFYYQDDENLVREYMTDDLGLRDLLVRFRDLPVEKKISLEVTKNASHLLTRLQHTARPVTTSASNGLQHIMLSYASDVKIDNVIHLQQELRRMGYDVWRDGDGSSIVPAMRGGLVERMYEAIDASFAVVVCVSRRYKESANCRIECSYCDVLCKERRLKIFYAMVDENYTTVSSPVTLNGWLHSMVCDALWYRLWSSDLVSSTASSLAKQFGDNAKRQAILPSVTSSRAAAAALDQGGGFAASVLFNSDDSTVINV